MLLPISLFVALLDLLGADPTRVVLSEEEYQALGGVSRQVDWRFPVALVLAHETGHRIGAITLTEAA